MFDSKQSVRNPPRPSKHNLKSLLPYLTRPQVPQRKPAFSSSRIRTREVSMNSCAYSTIEKASQVYGQAPPSARATQQLASKTRTQNGPIGKKKIDPFSRAPEQKKVFVRFRTSARENFLISCCKNVKIALFEENFLGLRDYGVGIPPTSPCVWA